jgi:hypothetical protein
MEVLIFAVRAEKKQREDQQRASSGKEVCYGATVSSGIA